MASLCALLVLCCACSADGDGLGGGTCENNGKAPLVNLNISVALPDVPGALTRQGGAETRAQYEPAQGDNERMHTLRIVIVRPDGTVEANRMIDLTEASRPAQERYGKEEFLVVAKETKRVYLFVNENTGVTSTATNSTRKLVDCDLSESSIKAGHLFPVNKIRGLKIRLEEDNEQIEGPLPMSEMHEVRVEDKDMEETLPVTRAAVKFTFNIINKSGREATLKGLRINKMANEEWYMPRAQYNDPENETLIGREVKDYDVPASGYYTYQVLDPKEEHKLTENAEKKLSPIYLLEGKYTDPEDSRNYSVEMTVNGIESKRYLDNLPTLPRNTHVVINVVMTRNDIEVEVQMVPYSEVNLEPTFGLNTDLDYVPVYDESGTILFWYDPSTGLYYDIDKTTVISNMYLAIDPSTGYYIIRSDSDDTILYYVDTTRGRYFYRHEITEEGTTHVLYEEFDLNTSWLINRDKETDAIEFYTVKVKNQEGVIIEEIGVVQKEKDEDTGWYIVKDKTDDAIKYYYNASSKIYYQADKTTEV